MRLKLFLIIALCGCMMSVSAQEKFLNWYRDLGTLKLFDSKEDALASYFIIGESEFIKVAYINNGTTRVDMKYKKYSVQNDGSVVYRNYNPALYPSLREFIVWPDKNVVIERTHYDTTVEIMPWLRESEWEKYPHTESDYKYSKYNGRQ